MIVQLCDTAASFCHYPNTRSERKLIPAETLKKALHMAMCENLNVQFLYPEYPLSSEYEALIESVDHAKVAVAGSVDNVDITILPSLAEVDRVKDDETVCVRLSIAELCDSTEALSKLLRRVKRLNVSLTDHHIAKEADMDEYGKALDKLAKTVAEEYAKEHFVQFNLLTDCLMLKEMNNCNAGFESVTLAPDGKFYICPAFYLEGENAVGYPETGINIPNERLFRLDHAPICRQCDAWQCRRCVWMNKKRTLEVNTPGKGQCITAHTERAASKRLKKLIDAIAPNNTLNKIKELDYNDPFVTATR